MKRFLAIILVFTSLLLTSCGQVKMYFSDDGILSDGDTEYRFAPVGYEPTYQGEEYAVIKGTMEETLYRIGNCDPEKWLATEYTGAATLVYYSTDITLPTLAEMNPTVCYICEQDAGAYSIYAIGADESNKEHDTEVMSRLVKLLQNNDENEIWPRSDIKYTYSLKFYSPDWEAIYYNVVYAVCSDGNYLYDRVTGNVVRAGNLLEEYYDKLYTEESDNGN